MSVIVAALCSRFSTPSLAVWAHCGRGFQGVIGRTGPPVFTLDSSRLLAPPPADLRWSRDVPLLSTQAFTTLCVLFCGRYRESFSGRRLLLLPLKSPFSVCHSGNFPLLRRSKTTACKAPSLTPSSTPLWCWTTWSSSGPAPCRAGPAATPWTTPSTRGCIPSETPVPQSAAKRSAPVQREKVSEGTATAGKMQLAAVMKMDGLTRQIPAVPTGSTIRS